MTSAIWHRATWLETARSDWDTAVITLIQEVRESHFEPGVRSLGLKEGGLSIGPFDTDLVTDDMQERLDELEKRIVDGEIIVDAQS